MSGHMTRMSRGSSVGSSASRPSSTSRSTSIWRAGPWQLCTCTERSSASQRSAFAPNGVGGDVGLQPAQQRVGAVVGRPRYSSVCGSAGRLRCSSRRSRPRVASSGWPTSRWLVSSRRGIWPWTSASDCHRSSLGCGSHRCRSWWVASASSSSISVLGSRVWPNSDSRSGRSVGDSCSVARVFACRMCGGSASTRSSSARHRGGCQSQVGVDVAGVVVLPVDEQLRPLPGVGREESGEPARHGVAPALPQLLLLALPRSGRGGWPASCTRLVGSCRR